MVKRPGKEHLSLLRADKQTAAEGSGLGGRSDDDDYWLGEGAEEEGSGGLIGSLKVRGLGGGCSDIRGL